MKSVVFSGIRGLMRSVFCFAVIGLSFASAEAQELPIVVKELSLRGEYGEMGIRFKATGAVEVNSKHGANISLLAGEVALLKVPEYKYGELTLEGNEYKLKYDRRGEYDFEVEFLVKVKGAEDLNSVDFKFLSSPIRQLELAGFPLGVELDIDNASTPRIVEDAWVTHLSPASSIAFRWRPAKTEEEGELFYTTDLTNVVVVAPGMIKQNQKAVVRVMQGELSVVEFMMRGPGQVSQVEGRDLLGWKVSESDVGTRRLQVRFSRPQTKESVLLIRSQTSLAQLPATTEILQLEPVAATRASGHLLLLNDGAVNLSVDTARNLSQISPAQVPIALEEREQLSLKNRQVFGYRFAGSGHSLVIEADDILPEISASAVTLYHFGLSETTIRVEMDLDIREAALRGFSLEVPEDYSVAGVEMNHMNDYLVAEGDDGSKRLRLSYEAPILGRHRLVLNLERNGEADEGLVQLPRVNPVDVKSIRGYVGLTADEGLKLSTGKSNGLGEMAPSYFPVKNDLLQLAYRIREADWSSGILVERLDSTVQAEAFHLFSLGEGVVYASSIVTYEIAGAPIQSLDLNLPERYENVELSGANIRDWRKSGDVYRIHFHTPISGTYSLLATYEAKAGSGDENLALGGAAPVGLQSERGYIVFVSPDQTELEMETVEGALLSLEPQELPPEYAIMVDAPIVSIYHYTKRPFMLAGKAVSLDREKSVDQVVELAKVETRITKLGEALYEANYVLKTKNRSVFSLKLPEGARLWKCYVDGSEAIPSMDEGNIFIPIRDTGSVELRKVSLKYTLQGIEGSGFSLETPRLGMPSLLTEWRLTSDPGYGLVFEKGTLAPSEWRNSVSAMELIGERLGSPGVTRSLVGLGILFFACVAIRFAILRGEFFERIPWVAPLGLLVLACSVYMILGLGANVAEPPTREVLANLLFTDSVMEADEAMAINVRTVDQALSSASEKGSVAWALLAVILPIIIEIGFRKAKASRALAIARLGLFGVGGVIVLWLPDGARLFVFYLGVAAFLGMGLDFAGRTMGLLRRSRKGSRKGISIVTLLVVGAAMMPVPDMDAQSMDGEGYVIAGPVNASGLLTEDRALMTVSFIWKTDGVSTLPVLFTPAVITRLDAPKQIVSLGQRNENGRTVYTLHASRSGRHEIEIEYETAVKESEDVWYFSLQSIPGLVYEAELEIDRKSCEIVCDETIGIEYEALDSGRTLARMRFRPDWDISLRCVPKTRDTRLEETVFYAEMVNTFHPQAGSIDGLHHASLRVAQGQLRELSLDIPEGVTVTDVNASWLDAWRFDPAKKKLEIASKQPLKGSISFSFRSQSNAMAMPYQASLKLPRLSDAASEVGWLGVATDSEGQLDEVFDDGDFAAVSVNDFPSDSNMENLASENVLRNAYRYADPQAELGISMSRVRAEIRVNSEERVSLGEDRIVYTATLKTEILRSGVFQIQLMLPLDYEVENISGPEISHWTESRKNGYRLATLHFKARTEGQTVQYLTLAGAGIREVSDWSPPKVEVVGASKQRGQLVLAPELGMRFDVKERTGVSQIDSTSFDSRDRNRLAFRLLEKDWRLAMDVQAVDAWVESALLQDVTCKEGVMDTDARIRFMIKNAGLKRLALELPEGAVGVKALGDHISHFQKSEDNAKVWEVEFDRRILGSYDLDLEYRVLVDTEIPAFLVEGIQCLGAQLQESFVSLRASQRFNLMPEKGLDRLSPVEWQQVPDNLKRGGGLSSRFVYRTIEPRYAATFRSERLKIADVLPAEMRSARLYSYLSEAGVALTRVEFRLDSGHKAHLSVGLPDGARFLTCDVEDHSVWPVEKEGKLLVPLERTGPYRDSITVSLSYLMDGLDSGDSRDLFDFVGPQCDLPMEDIEWTVYVPSRYNDIEWEGTLDKERSVQFVSASFDLEGLLAKESTAKNEKIASAESLLILGNSLADEGNQMEARRALESAYTLSLNDQDFNEDARVQWNNLRVQQALVGLTTRRSNAFGQSEKSGTRLETDEDAKLKFSRKEADELLLSQNTAEENRALAELARRFVSHQDAALRNPSSLGVLDPSHGTAYRFTRRLQAEAWEDMELELKAGEGKPSNAVALMAAFGVVALLTAAGGRRSAG